jgi:ferredoxin--NADP+ reductase
MSVRAKDQSTDDFRPDLPEVQMHLHTPAEPGVGVVVSNERCTGKKASSFVRHVEIDVSGTSLAGRFAAGQSFGVIAPGQDESGRPHKLRLYSIASPTTGEDGQGRVLSTTVKRLIDEHWERDGLFLGVTSNYLCDLKPGAKVTITGPSGKRFLVPKNASDHDYIFLATGTGIAPFRGMITDLLREKADAKIVLVMGAPYRTDLLYDDHFTELATKHANFTYLTAISRETQADGAPPLYVSGRLETHWDMFQPMLESGRGLLYVCGIAGMELGVFQELARLAPQSTLDAYLRLDPDARDEIDAWTRRMIHRQVKPTRRVFLEVY